MSKLFYSVLFAAVLLASTVPASANGDWVDGQDIYGGYDPDSTAAARVFWDRFNSR